MSESHQEMNAEQAIKYLAEKWGEQHLAVRQLKELAALQAKADRLAEALENMAAHEVDYMTRNHLGDPEKQGYMVMAREALAAYREGE